MKRWKQRWVWITLGVGLPWWAACRQPVATNESQPPAADPTAVQNTKDVEMSAATATSPLDFTMLDIEGLPVSLSQYKGQVVMFVNVASKCGLTPQYEQLQALHTRYEPQGLRILGFPANNFMGQEPGTNEQILEFCSTRFGVTFPMFAKISVKGRDQHELYKWLTSETTNPGFAGEIDWNFAKFLVGRDGRVIARFTARTKPDDAKVIAAIEEALKAPAPQRS